MSASALTRRDNVLRAGLITLIATVLALVAIGLATSSRGPFPTILAMDPFLVATAYSCAGWLAWARRPESRIGMLLLIAGVLYSVRGLVFSDVAFLFTLGWLVGGVYESVLGHMLLAFPTGRLRSRLEHVVVVAFYLSGVVGNVVASMFEVPPGACDCLPPNVALIADQPAVFAALRSITSVTAAILTTAFVIILTRHWRASAAGTKRALSVVYIGAAIGGVITLVLALIDAFDMSIRYSVTFEIVRAGVAIAVPFLFLIGLLRLQLTRGTLGDLVVELGGATGVNEPLRDVLARRLGEPSLELRYRMPDDSWLDDLGQKASPPVDSDTRLVHLLANEDVPFAAVITDRRLSDEVPELLDGVLAAARLAILNDRLRAEIDSQLKEVNASRRRILEATDSARRRVERDLHDGAQQRLVALSVGLRTLHAQVADSPELAREIDGLLEELRIALSELRELARGLHPTLLTEEGLGAAVESLTERSTIPVTLSVETRGRLTAPVEAAAYFVIAEAMANTSKHALASRAEIRVERHDGILAVDVTDDGVGGAGSLEGSGLTGLLDRLAAIGGTLRVDSPPDGGTHLHAEIPSS